MKITFNTTDKDNYDAHFTILYNTVKRCAEDIQARLPNLHEISLQVIKLSAYNPNRAENFVVKHDLSGDEDTLSISLSYYFPVPTETIKSGLSKELITIKDLYY